MARADLWTREQLLVALHIYLRTPFGKLHAKNPEIMAYADKIGRSSNALAMKCCNFASLDPSITNSGRVGLKGASNADKALWQETQTKGWTSVVDEMLQVTALLTEDQPSKSKLNNQVNDDILADYSAENVVANVKVRRGQNIFRQIILTSYNSQCCITGLNQPQLLIASHIKPWNVDEKQRLNPQNGLALNALHDKAFDRGFITIDDDLTVRVSNRIKQQNEFVKQSIESFHGKRLYLPERFMPDKELLAYHRSEIYRE